MSEAGMVIVGAGHAAVRAAQSIRAAGYDGTITMIAEEGVEAPYERPHLSKWPADEGITVKPIAPDDHLSDANLIRMNGTVETLRPEDHTVTLLGGRTLPYKRLLLATGAQARRLEANAVNGAHVHHLRDLRDARTLHEAAQSARTAAIIGGGFIGLELAASLRGMGISVHVIEMANRLLSRAVTTKVAQVVQELHEAHGVTFSLGARLAQSHHEGYIGLEDGTQIPADLIIAGIGSQPNTTLAETADLAIGNGIIVDARMCTSDADIFAAGDCCSFPLYGAQGTLTRLESWQAAGDQGALAGRNMVTDGSEHYTQVPWFWSNQYDHVLQVAGLSSQTSTPEERAYGPDHHISFTLTQDGTLESACGIAPGTKVAKDIRFAAKMIAADLQVEPALLRDPGIALKSLLRG